MATVHFARESPVLAAAHGRSYGALFLWLPYPVLLLILVGGAGLCASAPIFQEPAGKDVITHVARAAVMEQPVPFSHKQHLSFDMKCQECHPNPEPGDRMALPTADKCMECHRTIAKDKPSIEKLTEFAKSKKTIPWNRVYVVSGWVFWNHRSHLEAGMKCEMCHGEVSRMDVLTAATNVTTMAGCVDCHRRNDASTGCQYCHSGK